jgi:hypothetical protein
VDKRASDYLRGLGMNPAMLKGWKVRVAQRAGEDVAIVITSGPEIHFVSLGGPAMTRKNTLEFLAPLIKRFGYATTRVPREVTDHKLRNMLGFVPTWNDNLFTYWALTELPFQRRTHGR